MNNRDTTLHKEIVGLKASKLIHYTDLATGWMTGVNFPTEISIFISLWHRCVQTGSAVHAAYYPMGTGGSLPCGKAAGA
jgi:hypothetical protein